MILRDAIIEIYILKEIFSLLFFGTYAAFTQKSAEWEKLSVFTFLFVCVMNL